VALNDKIKEKINLGLKESGLDKNKRIKLFDIINFDKIKSYISLPNCVRKFS